MKKHKNKIITSFIIVSVLAFAFWFGGDFPDMQKNTTQQKDTITSVSPKKPAEAEAFKTEITATKVDEDETLKSEGMIKDAPIKEIGNSDEKENNPPTTDSTFMAVTEQKSAEIPIPIEPENAIISDKELTCTLSVRCDTILNNINCLDEEKIEFVPKDGIIFAEKTVTFYEGESVFNLLLREMKRNKIHMEFENIPIYNSAYIEGIANLYEFDCGELSGWLYKVNDCFPNYGCSRYPLNSGDKVEWVYTCDLGADVGGNYPTRNGR